MEKQESGALVGHGALSLPSVVIDSYNLEIRDKNGFIGDRASKSAFREKLDEWRKRVRKVGSDPLGDTPTKDLTTGQIDKFLDGDDKEAAAMVMGAIDDFADDLAKVLRRFLKEASWKNTERIVVGGGMKESELGELAIARAMILMKAEGVAIEIVPIAHHPRRGRPHRCRPPDARLDARRLSRHRGRRYRWNQHPRRHRRDNV